MALFTDSKLKISFNTVNYDGMDITKADEKDLSKAGLYSVNLVKVGPTGVKKIPMFVGPEEQANTVFSNVNNFWFSEKLIPLPEPEPLSFEEINSSFNEIIRGDSGADPGEFGLYKISGKVVLFIIHKGGMLENGFTEQRFFNVYNKSDKDTLLDFIQPFINPELFKDLRQYIDREIDLQQFKKRVKYIRHRRKIIRNEEFVPNQK